MGESYWNFEWLNDENCRQKEKHKRHNGKPVDVRHQVRDIEHWFIRATGTGKTDSTTYSTQHTTQRGSVVGSSLPYKVDTT